MWNFKAIREARAWLAERGKPRISYDKFWAGKAYEAASKVDKETKAKAYEAVQRENEARLKLFAAIRKANK